MTALSVPLKPSCASFTELVITFPLVILLAVVVDKFAPALRGALVLLSVNPLANLGLVPTLDVLNVILFVLNAAGALGTAFSM